MDIELSIIVPVYNDYGERYKINTPEHGCIVEGMGLE